MAPQQDDIIDQGADWDRQYNYEDSAGDPIALDSFRICAVDKHGGTPLFDYSDTDAQVTLDGPGGTVIVNFAGAITGAFVAGHYKYDVLVVETANGKLYRFIEGRLQVTPGVCL